MESNLNKALRESVKYFSHEARLATFKRWIFKMEDPCNVEKMAEAGFIFIGSKNEPDSVKCFFCNKQLDGWESDDNPWKEHFEHAPKCSFAKIQQPMDQITLKEYILLEKELVERIIKAYIGELTFTSGKFFKSLERKLKK